MVQNCLNKVERGWNRVGDIAQCTPKVSLLVGLKQVQTQLLSFYVTLIDKNPKEEKNPNRLILTLLGI